MSGLVCLGLFCVVLFSSLFVSGREEILLKMRNFANLHQGIENKVRRVALGLGVTGLLRRCFL